MKKMKKIIPVILLALSLALPLKAQRAFKTNILYDLTLSVNFGAEFLVAPQWSVDATVSVNEWTKWKNVMFAPEVRYWIREGMEGGFFAGNVIFGYGDAGLVKLPKILSIDFSKWEDFRYKGPIFGIGAGYGYSFPIGADWNLELEACLGLVHFKYDKYDASGEEVATGVHKNYFYPTKLCVNLVKFF